MRKNRRGGEWERGRRGGVREMVIEKEFESIRLCSFSLSYGIFKIIRKVA
jgi:hypothetical protein